MPTGRALHDGEAVRGVAGHRARLLAGVPATERRIEAAGIPATILEGGGGPPVVLLHGPGESALVGHVLGAIGARFAARC